MELLGKSTLESMGDEMLNANIQDLERVEELTQKRKNAAYIAGKTFGWHEESLKFSKDNDEYDPTEPDAYDERSI